MATKLYNSHLKLILECSKSGYLIDTYIALVHISSEINGRYIIQTYDNSKNTVVTILKNIVKSTPKTVYNCLCKLIDLNIISFDDNLNAWILKGMEKMNISKDKYKELDSANINSSSFNSSGINSEDGIMAHSGYTHIRKFFLTGEFANMKSREKRLVIYMSQLCDSKASTFHNGFSVNLLKYNSVWLKIINTKSIYYAKYTIERLLSNYNELFINKTETFRVKDLSPDSIKNFKFSFNCNSIENKNNVDDEIEVVKLTNPKEHLLIMEKISFADITLSKQKIMHLTRAISNLKEWFLKDRVAQIIINKYKAIQFYKSREDIKSLPAYAAAVSRIILLEYKELRCSSLASNITNNENINLFINNKDDIYTSLINKNIKSSLDEFRKS